MNADVNVVVRNVLKFASACKGTGRMFGGNGIEEPLSRNGLSLAGIDFRMALRTVFGG